MHFFRIKNSRIPTLILALTVFATTYVPAQVDAYFSSAKFNTPSNQPYLETYLTLVGKSLAVKAVDNRLQNSINIELNFLKTACYIKRLNIIYAVLFL